MKEVKKGIMEIIAILLIWFAIDYGRQDDFKYDVFSNEGILQFFLVLVALLLYKYAGSN